MKTKTNFVYYLLNLHKLTEARMNYSFFPSKKINEKFLVNLNTLFSITFNSVAKNYYLIGNYIISQHDYPLAMHCY